MGLVCDIKARRPDLSLDAKFEIGNEFAVLFGRSGCGKTTLLNCIAGLINPDSGVIETNGVKFYDAEANVNLVPQQRKVGYVFQHSYLFPHLSVFENIAFGLDKKTVPDFNDRVSELVSQFHLQGHERKKPSQLSGGQIQRVALARALAIKPSLLLLDEPFSALDAELRDELGSELQSVQRRMQLPVIMVTHSQSEAERLADTVVFLKDGTVASVGPPGNVFGKNGRSHEQEDLH
jgi:molybdate transport system ATP-binding protein